MNLNTIKLSLSNLGEHISELEQRVGSKEDNLSDYGKLIKVAYWRVRMLTCRTKWTTQKTEAEPITCVSFTFLKSQRARTPGDLSPV